MKHGIARDGRFRTSVNWERECNSKESKLASSSLLVEEGPGEMLDFKDKVVLITGAAQGFGRVLAHAFAEQGARLALCDINDQGGEETLALVKAQGADGLYQHADMSLRKRPWRIS